MSSGCAPRKSTFFPKKFMLLMIHHGVRAHRKCSKCLDLYRGGVKTEALIGEVLQPAHVLADGDAIAKQNGMSRASAIRDVVYVVGINPHEGGTCIRQELCRLSCEEGMSFEILIGTPVTRPSCVD